MVKIDKKESCYGCTACYSICPKKAISMEDDSEGFKYPHIDKNKCNNCGLCERVCPYLEKGQYNECLKKYACQNINGKVRKRSTSGGVFSLLAEFIISNGGNVYAVGFDRSMNVVHKCAKSINEIYDLVGSKYVQSNLQDIFVSILDKLLNKKKVLFLGTPCQVEGLLNYINQKKTDYLYTDYLYTVDLICYGVPSPGVYRKWIDYIEKKYKSKIIEIYFRDKKYGYAGSNIKINLSNNRVLEDSLDSKSYLKTMFSHIGLRPSCYECRFRTSQKKCDLTIGDMHNIIEYNKKMDDNKGTSYLQIHSKKGIELFEMIKEKLKYYEIIDEKYNNGSSTSSIKIPKNRKEFFEDSNLLKYDELIDKYFPTSKKDFIANKIKPLIGSSYIGKKIIKKIRIKNIRKK